MDEISKKIIKKSIKDRCEQRFADAELDENSEISLQSLAAVSVELLRELVEVK